MSPRSRLLIVNLLVLDAALIADQVSKYVMTTSSGFKAAGDVLFLHLGIAFTLNRGFAFSLPAPHWLIVVVALAIFIAVLHGWYKEWVRADRRSVALALVIAGGTGNLVDRLRLGGVVDFLEVGIKGFSTSSFNLADIFIIAGVLLWLFLASRTNK